GFTTAGGTPTYFIARWNGTVWSPVGDGMGGTTFPGVSALTTLPNGDFIAGGQFATAGGKARSYIARWNGSAWSSLGPGMNDSVFALNLLPNGDLAAGGNFT